MSILLESISKRYGSHLIVDDFSLQVQDGEMFVLLGASGSGKSTVLRIIAGLTPADSGRVVLHDREVTHTPPQKRDIGLVFQNYSVFRHMTAGENIEFGLRLRKVPADERSQRREEMLDLVGLAGMGSRYPHQLSGGQQQRVALARALVYQPKVLLLDEPFGALDVKIRGQLRRSLKRIQRRLGVTTIVVTHDQEEAFELADRIGVVEKGRLLEVGRAEDLYYRPQNPLVASFVGGGTIVVGRITGGQAAFGSLKLPVPAGVPSDENRRVQLLVRPEQVALCESAPEGELVAVGLGRIVEEYFTGAMRRVRLRLPRLSGTRQIVPPPPFGEDCLLVDAVVPAHGRLTLRDYHVALRDWHIMQAPPLRLLALRGMPGEFPAPDLLRWLVERVDGSATILAVTGRQPDIEQRAGVESVVGEPGAAQTSRLEFRERSGAYEDEVAMELEESLYDLVYVSRGTASGGTGSETEIPDILDALMQTAGLPLLIADDRTTSFQRMMICTGAGEPGKQDVRDGGRIARRLGLEVVLLHVAAKGRGATVARNHLERAAATLRSLDLKVEVRALEGDNVVETILTQARETASDLIVMGRHIPASRLFSGPDITRQVIALADRPVWVIPVEERRVILPDAPAPAADAEEANAE